MKPCLDLVIIFFQVLMQMKIRSNKRRIYSFLKNSRGGHIYVCGDFYMANDVKSVIVSIFQEYGNINADAASSALIFPYS